jgi:transposase
MSYSIDLREKLIRYLSEGNSQRRAAKVFGVDPFTVNKWNKMYKTTGSLEDSKPKRSFKKIDPEKLKQFVEENPDAYLIEIAPTFCCTADAIGKALRRLNITRKKRGSSTANKTPKK